MRNPNPQGHVVPGKDFYWRLLDSARNFPTFLYWGALESAQQEMGHGDDLLIYPLLYPPSHTVAQKAATTHCLLGHRTALSAHKEK